MKYTVEGFFEICYNGFAKQMHDNKVVASLKNVEVVKMANVCEYCGNKNNFFGGDPVYLNNESFLCSKCASPIKEKISTIYNTKHIEEFQKYRSEILEISETLYNESVIQKLNQLFDKLSDRANFDSIQSQSTINRIETAERIKNHKMTTGYNFEGYEIKTYMGVISGQVVLGTGFLSEWSASLADFLGEESDLFADKIEKAKNAAVERLINKSVSVGGNAIIGVDFDYITFRNNMIGVVANGTSVFVEKIVKIKEEIE